MGFLDSVLKVFVGDKAKQDVKAIMPIVEQVKSHEKAMEALSIDELRNKTVAFKAKIEDALKDINAEKESLKSEADASTDIDRNEDIYAQIDALDEKAYQITEGILNDILPEAFAVVKETAKRFCHNEEIEVTATPFDRELSAEKDYVTLSGEEKAIWKNYLKSFKIH